MSLEDKMKNAKESTWLTDGLTKKEVAEIVSKAKKEARKVDLIIELEKIKEEIRDLIDFEESCCGNTTLGYECLGVIKNKIDELKGEQE